MTGTEISQVMGWCEREAKAESIRHSGVYDARIERQGYHLRLRLSVVTVTFQDMITYAYVMKSVS